jgi:prevent-host-death family protein
MDESISAADANRNFSQLLRGVREGRTFVVTSHGKPVARISPAEDREAAADAAREALLRHLARQPNVDVGPWTREELYDDDP